MQGKRLLLLRSFAWLEQPRCRHFLHRLSSFSGVLCCTIYSYFQFPPFLHPRFIRNLLSWCYHFHIHFVRMLLFFALIASWSGFIYFLFILVFFLNSIRSGFFVLWLSGHAKSCTRCSWALCLLNVLCTSRDVGSWIDVFIFIQICCFIVVHYSLFVCACI